MSEELRDIRLRATEIIWKYGVGMLIVSLPFVLFGRFLFLPAYVVLAAGFSASAVWLFGGNTSKGPSAREKELEERLASLEKRLENVETIGRFESRLEEQDSATARSYEISG